MLNSLLGRLCGWAGCAYARQPRFLPVDMTATQSYTAESPCDSSVSSSRLEGCR